MGTYGDIVIDVKGDGNVIGNIGHTIIQALKPELAIANERREQMGGQIVTEFTITVISDITPGCLFLELLTTGLKDVSIMPPAVGGFASMTQQNVRQGPKGYATEIPTPRGTYNVKIVTAEASPIELRYSF